MFLWDDRRPFLETITHTNYRPNWGYSVSKVGGGLTQQPGQLCLSSRTQMILNTVTAKKTVKNQLIQPLFSSYIQIFLFNCTIEVCDCIFHSLLQSLISSLPQQILFVVLGSPYTMRLYKVKIGNPNLKKSLTFLFRLLFQVLN